MIQKSTHLFCAFLLCVFSNASSLSQQKSDSLSMYNVNNWNFLGTTPYPLLLYDTNNTGMALIPTAQGSTDSIQLFQQYGNTVRFGNEWTIGFAWIRQGLTAPQFIRPKYVLLDIQTRSYVNLAYLDIGIVFADTITNSSGFTWDRVELRPDWQTFQLQTDGLTLIQYVHKITLEFLLYGPDSTYIGLEILCNNMRFVYPNGDTILVDPFQYTMPSGIVEQLPGIPEGFILHQNYPNPFNPTTVIRYEVTEASVVKLSIYSLLGEKIADLIDEFQNTGIYEARFDASNLASGTYIYILQIDKFTLRRKMVLLK